MRTASATRPDHEVAAEPSLQDRLDRLEELVAELESAIKRSPLRLIPLSEVERRLTLKKSAVYDRIQKKELPSPVRIGGDTPRFVESEIEAYIEARIRERDEASSETKHAGT